jgi:hypothetical protein
VFLGLFEKNLTTAWSGEWSEQDCDAFRGAELSARKRLGLREKQTVPMSGLLGVGCFAQCVSIHSK